MIRVYQLVTKKGGVSLSPFVAAVEKFLKHKSLDFESIPLTFVQVAPTIRRVTGGEWESVPTVIFPNGDIVFDSPKVAKYLDEKYPDNPLNPNSSDLDNLIDDYNTKIYPNAFRNTIDDLFSLLDDENQKYFRESREKFFKMKLEEVSGDRKVNTQQYIDGVKIIDDLLLNEKFLNGEKPLIHDYTLISRIKFLQAISPRTYKELVLDSPNENLKRWVKDMDKV